MTNSVQSSVARSIAKRLRDLITLLASVLNSSVLEHCVQFWDPEFKKNIGKLVWDQCGCLSDWLNDWISTWGKTETTGLVQPKGRLWGDLATAMACQLQREEDQEHGLFCHFPGLCYCGSQSEILLKPLSLRSCRVAQLWFIRSVSPKLSFFNHHRNLSGGDTFVNKL